MNKGKNLLDIPFDKVYIGMPVVNCNSEKGSVVYKDSSVTVKKMFVIKKESGHFNLSFVKDNSARYGWYFDMSRESEMPQ